MAGFDEAARERSSNGDRALMVGAREQVKLEPATRQALRTNISTSEPGLCDFAIPCDAARAAQ
ncbi:MAG: hypothetical protein RL685_6521 [Pseudomonadota bacterium]|jgi:hypothetical protein